MLVIAGLILVSCSDDDQVPDGPVKIKWEKVSYKSKQINEQQYYIVPQQGGNFTFVMKMNDPESLKLTVQEAYMEQSSSLVWSSWVDVENPEDFVKRDGQRVDITFLPNDSITHYVDVSFSDGLPVYYGNLLFVQEGAK